MKAYDISVEVLETSYDGPVVKVSQDDGQTVIHLMPEQIDLFIKWLKLAKDDCHAKG